ncbi:UDP-3-O-(3-hydroxymyristoyl)glucosamine N-acyltransferase [Haloferula sp.]|uniref:UDP-3-O-(3-hydroxymyristoyl)glucosamine N-acyltransferase n=1 Tax=Haloferula sp. TaxID=2497595 RepID=UPI00329EA1CF
MLRQKAKQLKRKHLHLQQKGASNSTLMSVALTLSELAQLVDGDIVRGELSVSYGGIASLDEAAADDISFLGNEKYHSQFLETKAGVVIVPKGLDSGPDGVALIATENPSFAFGSAVKHFTAAHTRQFEPGVHPKAIVDESVVLDESKVRIHAGAVVMAGSQIGEGSEIGPNVVVGEEVVIGRDCHLHANVSIRERCILGDRVIVQPGAVIGSDGFGYETVAGRHEKIDQIGIVALEDDVEIGANTTIDRARFGRTVIGEGTKVDNLVQIAHNVQVGKHNFLVSQSGIAGSSKTGDYVILAAQAGIAGHLKVGDHAMLAGRCGVAVDLEGGKKYGGIPAQPLLTHQRQQAAIRKLPELLKRVKKLEKDQ